MSIVFYDGECGLCQRSIQILLRIDKSKYLKFAPINGEIYMTIFKDKNLEVNSVLFYTNQQVYKKSSAVIEICKVIKRECLVLYLFKFLPLSMRDFLYDQIANRRKVFKCTMLQKDERFLN